MPYQTMPELANQGGYGYTQPQMQMQQNPFAQSSSPTYNSPQNNSLPGTYVYDNNATFANMNQGLPPTGVAANYANADTSLWDKGTSATKTSSRGVHPDKAKKKFLGCC